MATALVFCLLLGLLHCTQVEPGIIKSQWGCNLPYFLYLDLITKLRQQISVFIFLRATEAKTNSICSDIMEFIFPVEYYNSPINNLMEAVKGYMLNTFKWEPNDI
jgi:hypothetical protein